MGGARRPRVGFARVVVTESAALGSCGIHDELQARTLFLETQDGPALLISLDHMGLTPGRRAALKSRLARECGIPAARTAIFYSHTHAGADFRAGALAKLLARGVAEARAKAASCEVAYLRRDVGRRYSVNRRAIVGHGLGAVSIIFNRNVTVDLMRRTEEVSEQVRDFIRTGRNIWGTRYLQPEFDPPPSSRPLSAKQKALLKKVPAKIYQTGPVDPHLEWLAFRTLRGHWLGSIARFSAHPVMWRKSITNKVSADYVGILCRELERATGAPTLFVNGPCGDVKPLFRHYTEAEMERVGQGLARELLGREDSFSWEPLEKTGFAKQQEGFAVHPEVVKYAGRWPVEEAQRRQAELAHKGDPVAAKRALDWSLRCWGNGEIGWRKSTITLPFHLLSFNDIKLLGLPNEVWCEIGLEIKRRCKHSNLIVGANCDLVTNYVPRSGAMELGGYEAMNSMLREDAADDYLRIVMKLLEVKT